MCGNEEELTADDYDGYGTLESSDFLVCTDLPADGSACPHHDNVDPYQLFEDELGPYYENGCGYALRTDCGPETTIEDACCYVIEREGTWCK